MRASTIGGWRRAWFAAVVIGILTASGVQAQVRTEATPSFLFRVEIGGVDAGFFRSVSGLAIETEVIEFREGGSDVIHKLPGARKFPNIVLKRGFTGSVGLFNWVSSFKNGGTRFDGTLIMLSTSLTEIARWQFHNGFPVKWEGPEFDASKNEVAIETLEIAHEGLTMVKP